MSAHHDAHRCGVVFHPRLTKVSARLFGPSRDHRAAFSLVLASMLAVSVGSLARVLGIPEWVAVAPILIGGFCSLVFALVILDIARQPVSPGANDDSTGVAVLLALAEAIQREPPLGLEVWFLSTGSEEGVLGGMRAFLDQHRRELREGRPFVLNLEMLGSGRVRYVKGEGFLRHYCYRHEAVARAAEVARASRFSGVAALETVPFFTDALAATRVGIPAFTVTSLNDDGYVPHYHWPSDTPDNLDFNSVKHAYDFCHEIIRRLDSDERKEVQR